MAPLPPKQEEPSASNDSVMASLLHVSVPADDDAEFDGENLVISNDLAIGWVRWSRIPCVLHVENDGNCKKAGIKEKYWLWTVDGGPSDRLMPEQVAAALRKGASLGFTTIPPRATPTAMDKSVAEGLEGYLGIAAKEEMLEEASMAREEADGTANAEGASLQACKAEECTTAAENMQSDADAASGGLEAPEGPPALVPKEEDGEGASASCDQGVVPTVPPPAAAGESTAPSEAIPSEHTGERLPFAPPPLSERKRRRNVPKRQVVLKANPKIMENESGQVCKSRLPVPNSMKDVVLDAELAALIDKGLSQEEFPPPPPPDYRKHRSRGHHSRDSDYDPDRRSRRRHSRDYEDDNEATDRSLLGDSERRKRRRQEADQELSNQAPQHEADAVEMPERPPPPPPLPSAEAEDNTVEEASAVPQRTDPAHESRQPQEGSDRSASVEAAQEETVEFVWKTFGDKPLHQIIKELNEGQRAQLRDYGVLDVLQGKGSIRRMPLRPQYSRPEGCNVIWVGWFDRSVSTRDVRSFFERCGPVQRVFKGDHFAHVHYEEPHGDRAVKAALDFSGELLINDPIRVEYRDVKGWTFEEREFRDRQHLFNRQCLDLKKKDWYCSACGMMNYFYRDICMKCQANKLHTGWTMPLHWQSSSSSSSYHRRPQPPPPLGVQPPPRAVVPRSLGGNEMPPQPPPAAIPAQPATQPAPTSEAWGPWAPPTWLRQPPASGSQGAAPAPGYEGYYGYREGMSGATLEPTRQPPPAYPPPGANGAVQYWQYPMAYDLSPSYTDTDSYYSESSSSISSRRKKQGKRSSKKSRRSSKAGQSQPPNAVVPKVPADSAVAP
mmetsp:Transcript_15786/g.29118  ORF Transcript_15786/g.29118 Transcript_15786/m.29118 type:complete len:837 (+) Transcript_15786:259-2769(+)